jgi:hypothetical protein
VQRFWRILGLFWNEDRVKSWQTAILPTGDNLRQPRDGCFNMLSLNKHAHALWGAARFALRPVLQTPDEKMLKVEFHWQKQSVVSSAAEVDLLAQPVSTRGFHGERGNVLMFTTGTFDEDGTPIFRGIRSGKVFTITTKDPVRLPLPSWPLLEMQWYLQRVVAMSAAAEPPTDSEVDEWNSERGTTRLDRDTTARRIGRVSEWLGITPNTGQVTGGSAFLCS